MPNNRLIIDVPNGVLRVQTDAYPECRALQEGLIVKAMNQDSRFHIGVMALILDRHIQAKNDQVVSYGDIADDVELLAALKRYKTRSTFRAPAEAVRVMWMPIQQTHRGFGSNRMPFYKSDGMTRLPDKEAIFLRENFRNYLMAKSDIGLSFRLKLTEAKIEMRRPHVQVVGLKQLLSEIRASVKPERPPSADVRDDKYPDVTSGLVDYLAWLNRHLSASPLLERLHLKLDALRIPLSAVPFRQVLQAEDIMARERFRLNESVQAEPELRSKIYAFRNSAWDSGTAPDRKPVKDWVDQLDQCILLGDPGSGKTEWLKFNSKLIAQATLKLLQGSKIEKHPPSIVIPVYVRLSRVAEALNHADDILDLLKSADVIAPGSLLTDYELFGGAILFALCQTQKIVTPLIQVLWRSLWDDGNKACRYHSVLHLDAWDEVRSNQEGVAERLNVFAANVKARLIISSRVIGYKSDLISLDRAPGGKRKELQLCPFRKPDTARFIGNFFAANPDLSQRLLADLDARPSVAGMIQNPLLATLLCKVYSSRRQSDRLPTQRCEVYEVIIKGMLGQWPALDKGQMSNSEVIECNLRLLEDIAFKYFPNETLASSELTDYFWNPTDGYMNRMDESHPVKAMLRRLENPSIVNYLCKDGIIVPLDEQGDWFTFLHLTFQEYLVARALSRQPQWAAIVHANMYDPMWMEPLALLGGILSQDIKSYIPRLLGCLPEDLALRPLEIAVRALHEVPSSIIPAQYHAALYEYLLKEFAHPKEWVKPEFIYGLLRSWGEKALDILIRLMTAPDKDTSLTAIALLADSGPKAIPYIRPLLKSKERADLRDAVQMVAKYPSHDDLPALLPLLKLSFPDVAEMASAAIGKIGNGAVAPLINMMKAGNKRTLVAVIGALGYCRSEKAVPCLLQQIKTSRDATLTAKAVHALGFIGSPAAASVVKKLTCSTSIEVQVEALVAHARISGHEKREADYLATFMNSPNEDVRESCVRALGESNESVAVPVLRKALQDPCEAVCLAAIAALTEYEADAKDDFIKLIRSPSARIRKAVVQSLRITTEEGMATVVAMLNDPDNDVRIAALSVLVSAGSAARPDIIRALTDNKNEAVLFHAARALGEIGAIEDIQRLKALLDNPEWGVRIGVVPAMAQIGRRNKQPISWDIITNRAMRKELDRFRNDILSMAVVIP
ncbi:MAG: HEAT repeat domain-containing protein [Kiritimatiellae bacterium]|nr:HEAT repeat domain-containing protein [Kiritimatiellia bacterium]